MNERISESENEEWKNQFVEWDWTVDIIKVTLGIRVYTLIRQSFENKASLVHYSVQFKITWATSIELLVNPGAHPDLDISGKCDQN